MSTLKDIAAVCGVSSMTVSDVLNGKERAASAETRERIQKAAQQLDYRPHAVARSLRRQRTNILGYYAGYGYSPMRSPFTSEIASGLQDGCEEAQRDLLTHGTFRGRSVDSIYCEMVSGQIDGLIVLAPLNDPLISKLAHTKLPVVGIADLVPNLPSVVVDDYQAGQLLARHLLAQGHRRAVFYTSDCVHASVQRRVQGFRKEFGIVGTELALVPVDWHGRVVDGAEADFFALSSLLGAERAPTAAVCWNDSIAYALLEECLRLRVRVPDDLAIAGFDGISAPYRLARQVTSVRMPWAEVAHTTVSLLVSLIEGKEVAQETVLDVEFLVGDTT